MEELKQDEVILEFSPSIYADINVFFVSFLVILSAILGPHFLELKHIKGLDYLQDGAILGALLYSSVTTLQTFCQKYILSEQQFKEQYGVLSRYTHTLELYRIKDISLEEPLLLRAFGLSNIYLATSDRSTPFVIIRGVRSGEKLLELLRHKVEEARSIRGVREVDME